MRAKVERFWRGEKTKHDVGTVSSIISVVAFEICGSNPPRVGTQGTKRKVPMPRPMENAGTLALTFSVSFLLDGRLRARDGRARAGDLPSSAPTKSVLCALLLPLDSAEGPSCVCSHRWISLHLSGHLPRPVCTSQPDGDRAVEDRPRRAVEQRKHRCLTPNLTSD